MLYFFIKLTQLKKKTYMCRETNFQLPAVHTQLLCCNKCTTLVGETLKTTVIYVCVHDISFSSGILLVNKPSSHFFKFKKSNIVNKIWYPRLDAGEIWLQTEVCGLSQCYHNLACRCPCCISCKGYRNLYYLCSLSVHLRNCLYLGIINWVLNILMRWNNPVVRPWSKFASQNLVSYRHFRILNNCLVHVSWGPHERQKG